MGRAGKKSVFKDKENAMQILRAVRGTLEDLREYICFETISEWSDAEKDEKPLTFKVCKTLQANLEGFNKEYTLVLDGLEHTVDTAEAKLLTAEEQIELGKLINSRINKAPEEEDEEEEEKEESEDENDPDYNEGVQSGEEENE